ncbi:MAG: hypothetical protein FD165_2634 [Gammaproteobacteria bacterium]|nr:MAG: hypothetical protein FD165_2634 [Gammaproteobacteria bacterium]TND01607.1 MAG: hypothetical protein FD120_2555 [Gammaproteobacteria bacterium]
MIQAEKIAEVMGVTCRIHSLFDLAETVAHGLPKKALQATIKHLTLDSETAKLISNQLVPPATFKRRKTRLSPQESERVERLARVYATALDVWDDDDDTRQFLFAPHAMLNQKRPIDVAFTELGARQIEQILSNIKYGLPA